MKHSELRHQPRHVNPRIQDYREETRWTRTSPFSSCILHKIMQKNQNGFIGMVKRDGTENKAR